MERLEAKDQILSIGNEILARAFRSRKRKRRKKIMEYLNPTGGTESIHDLRYLVRPMIVETCQKRNIDHDNREDIKKMRDKMQWGMEKIYKVL